MPQEEFTDAIAMLKADHRKVEDLFDKFCSASARDRKVSLAREICNELKIHSMLEEEIFYPACQGEVEDDLYHEAIIEHDSAKVLINDIMASDGSEEFFDAKVTVLKEEILHHVKEEEKPGEGFFAQARGSGVDLVALCDRMVMRKEELMMQAEDGGLPPAKLAALQLQPA
jgi:hypothetical protein